MGLALEAPPAVAKSISTSEATHSEYTELQELPARSDSVSMIPVTVLFQNAQRSSGQPTRGRSLMRSQATAHELLPNLRWLAVPKPPRQPPRLVHPGHGDPRLPVNICDDPVSDRTAIDRDVSDSERVGDVSVSGRTEIYRDA